MTPRRPLQRLLVAIVVSLASVIPAQAFAATAGDGGTASGLLDPVTATLLTAGDGAFAQTDLTAAVTGPGSMHFGAHPPPTGGFSTCRPGRAPHNTLRHFTIRQID